MDFGDAIKAIRKGERVKRANWGGYWYLPRWANFDDYTIKDVNDGDSSACTRKFNPMIVAKLKDNQGYAPATPYMADLLADDWEIVK